MFKHIAKSFGLITTAFALVFGLVAFVAPAANADTGSSGFEFEVTSTSQGTPTVHTTVTNTQQALVNGATQLLWWYPNHHIKVTMKSVKKAPHIRINATGANASKVIAKRTHGASIVVLKVGSVVRNTGRLGNIVGGFKWKVTKHQAVLKWNKKLGLYQHVFNLVGGKLVKTCGNHIGGRVHMYQHVVQVRYAQDLLMESDAESVAKAEVTFNFSVTCPSTGANFHVQGSAYAYGRASDHVKFTQRTRATVIGKLETKAKQNISIDQNVEANAQASVKISGSCGSTPPPSTPAPQLLEITTVNDVQVNHPEVLSVTGSIASGHTGTLFCTALNGGTITAGKSQTVSGSFTASVAYKAPSEVPGANSQYGIPAGHDQVKCTLTQDDGQMATILTDDSDEHFMIRVIPPQSE